MGLRWCYPSRLARLGTELSASVKIKADAEHTGWSEAEKDAFKIRCNSTTSLI